MKQTVCSIPDCNRKALKRGFCNSHYLRWWRHGDPLHGRALYGDALAWLHAHKAYEGDDCKLWPYGVGHATDKAGGYGAVRYEGRAHLASHVMCKLAHGPAPDGKPYAAHSCHTPRCCNPNHLRWASGKENQADRAKDGTLLFGENSPTAKLKEWQVLEVRARAAKGERPVPIARSYNVSLGCIDAIIRRKTWKHI